MTSFADLGLRRWWDPDEREAVRAVNAAYWPRVRAQLMDGQPPDTSLTDIPVFRDMVRDAVLYDGWGAEDLAVWFGVSGQRARVWVSEVLEPGEEVGPTSWRVWALDRFVPVGPDEARARASHAAVRTERSERLDEDVAALQRFVDEHGRIPRATEFAEYHGHTYQAIGNRWPGSYADGWDLLYEEAGYKRPGRYNV